MLNFGKYKGTDISKIWNFDSQYIIWLVNNIKDINSRVDEEDKLFLKKIFYPYLYLNEKYGNIFNKKQEEIIDILKKEGYVKSAYTYVSPSEVGGLCINVDTIYGFTVGVAGSSIDHRSPDGGEYNLINEIQKHLDKPKKWLNK